jgi:predicted TIM-barrel fold metal-dependent hydrolase
VAKSVPYRWALRQLGDVLRQEPTEECILRSRESRPFAEYCRDLAQRGNISCILLDEGYPPLGQAYASDEIQSMLGVSVQRIVRIETLLQELIPGAGQLSDVVSAFDGILNDVRAAGYVAIKTIAAYRTGLQIEPVSDRELDQAFEALRANGAPGTAFRLQSKTIVDYFVIRALRHAANQGIPVQFHTGYGDPDLDLRLANPLHLRPIFEDRELSGAPIVMLHASYPFTAEAAYLAAVYPNAYLDIAYCLPPLDWFQLLTVTRIALGAAPAGKLMSSSDGVGIPEHYWLGATRARALVSRVLDDMVGAGELGDDEAQEMGEMLLNRNATDLYGLGGAFDTARAPQP